MHFNAKVELPPGPHIRRPDVHVGSVLIPINAQTRIPYVSVGGGCQGQRRQSADVRVGAGGLRTKVVWKKYKISNVILAAIK